MMRQYREIKEEVDDAILFFRMGDFYEMFFDDARLAAPILEITLTERQKGVPMAGIPYHAAETYVKKLIKNGRKVAICEQLETKPPKGEKIVRRQITQIITPGTYVEEGSLSNYLLSFYISKQELSTVVADTGTGEIWIFSGQSKHKSWLEEELFQNLNDILVRYPSKEIILFADLSDEYFRKTEIYLEGQGYIVNILDAWIFDQSHIERFLQEFYQVISLDSLLQIAPAQQKGAARALTAALYYIKENQRRVLSHIQMPRILGDDSYLHLDESAIRSLELLHSMHNYDEISQRSSLFHTMDRCSSILGRRRLKQEMLYPLRDVQRIEKRLDQVSFFLENSNLLSRMQEPLSQIRDIEQFTSKISRRRVFPRDLELFRHSLHSSLKMMQLLNEEAGEICQDFLPAEDHYLTLEELYNYLDSLLMDELPFNFDGEIIKEGFCAEVDRLRSLSRNSQQWLKDYQEQERKSTGINTLKVKYNKIFGYFIEISKGQSSQAPGYYLRKQTLVNAERFTTEQLQKYEEEVLVSRQKLQERELELFEEAVEKIEALIAMIQEIASAVGYVDFLISMAKLALENNYCRPQIVKDPVLRIVEGRHPVVENFLEAGEFVSNDLLLNQQDRQIAIITGPNMAGKSTYIRQNALIALMAHMGSFVPAKEANIGVCDRIFTRIGSGDNLARGQSTFLLEMQEMASILHNYAKHSLIVLDEIGRGTSTYDGLAIAWSILEYLARPDATAARVLFATHFHELTVLANRRGIFNLTLEIEENRKGITFLRRIIDGSADRSYGVHVAKLAGIPHPVLRRAASILEKLEDSNEREERQLDIFAELNRSHESFTDEGLFSPDEVILHPQKERELRLKEAVEEFLEELKSSNLDEMTPMEALQKIQEWKKRFLN